MRIDLQSLQAIQPDTHIKTNNQNEENSIHNPFSDQLKQALGQLNQSQIESGIKTEMFVNGQIDELHDVMITAQKASLSMSLAVEVQGKVIDAYNEIMRMQI